VKKTTTPEKMLENSIMEYLQARPDTTAWKQENIGTYDPRKKTYRKRGKYQMEGVADVMGFYRAEVRIYQLFIEIKQPGASLSDAQVAFLWMCYQHGALAMCVTSVDELRENLLIVDASFDYSNWSWVPDLIGFNPDGTAHYKTRGVHAAIEHGAKVEAACKMLRITKDIKKIRA